MVMASWLEEKLRRQREKRLAEARAEAGAEARAEANAEWRAWLGRMRESQASGEPFDEPAPSEETA